MRNSLILLLIAALLTGCVSWKVPKTLGDPSNAPSYGYTPIDPLPVTYQLGVVSPPLPPETLPSFSFVSPSSLPSSSLSSLLLNALPDETVRLAIGQLQSDGGITFGPAKVGVKGGSYVVILDYIKFDTKSFGVDISETFSDKKNGERTAVLSKRQNPDVLVPVYIGIGLRLTANVTVHQGTIDLGNLLALGVSAQTKKITGTLVIQSLGISGEGVTGAIPLPSEINQTSVQNAIQALGAIRANIYAEKTKIRPRVVGIYNNLGGGQKTINGFISSLLQEPIVLALEVPH